MNVEFHKPDRAVVEQVVAKMREVDRAEVIAMSPPDADILQSVLDVVKRSRRVRVAFVGGRPVAVLGILPRTILGDVANPWMLATSEFEKPDVRRAVVEVSREHALWMMDGYRRVWNLILARNTVSIRWLKWLGFSFDDRSYEINGQEFYLFSMEAT